jgi:hypothetical protein
MPVLLFHGIDDSVVPIRDSDKFAEELGKSMTCYRVPHADHTQAWNVDPHLYERRVSHFLLQIKANRAAKEPGNRTSPTGAGRARTNKEPAATYSPRGLPPKYHRR